LNSKAFRRIVVGGGDERVTDPADDSDDEYAMINSADLVDR
jgi:hypothetical protein